MSNGCQSTKINKETGDILWRGYLHPFERASEASADMVGDNLSNKDSNVVYLVTCPNAERTGEQRITSAKNQFKQFGLEWPA